MAGFLTNLGLAAGRNILFGQEFQEKQADLDLKKQQLAMGQMAMQNAQRQQQTQQAVGSFLSSEASKDSSNVADPQNTARMYQKAAGIALQSGDFASANTMEELAKGKLNEVKEQASLLQQQQQVKKEALANSADDYATNPSPENQRELMRKAVDAGVNPTTIPQPGTPQFGKWANDQQLASKTAAQKADFVQKAYEMDANRQEKQQEHADRERDAQLRRQDLAMQREGNQQMRMMQLSMERERLDAAKAKVGTGSPAEQGKTDSTIKAASAVVRDLRNVALLPEGQTGGLLSHLGNHADLMSAAADVGLKKITPGEAQAYDAAMAGIGLGLARMETASGGRGANQSIINEFQRIAASPPGTPNIVALYKLANVADMVKNQLRVTRKSTDENIQSAREDDESFVKSIPTTAEVIALAKKNGWQDQLTKGGDMQAAMNKLTEGSESGLPGTPDAGAGTNAPPLPKGGGLPPGVTVEIH